MEILKENWVQDILNNDTDTANDSSVKVEPDKMTEVNLFDDSSALTSDEVVVLGPRREDDADSVDMGDGGDSDMEQESVDGDSDVDDDEIKDMTNKEYAKTIDLYFLYIKNDLTIDKIITEKVDLTEDGILKKELLLYLIQVKRKNKYKLYQVLLYQALIDEINDKIDNKLNNPSHLKILPVVNPVQLNQQIKLLHSTNAVYILLKEIDIMEKQSEVVNNRKMYKKVPYKKYTRKIKYLRGGGVSVSGGGGGDDKNKTRKNVSFDLDN